MCGRYILAEPLEFARVAALAENHWQAKAVLKPYPDRLMVAHRVSHRVNDPKNDGPELIEAVRSI